VVVLKRDAIARVVLNNLYKHTDLQTNFSANMLALVDDVPRTLPIDAFISNWISHQIDVIRRRTRYRLRKAEREAHIYRGLVKALDALDAVIALIRPQSDHRGGARGAQVDARDRRRPGARDPRHAAAPPCRTRAAAIIDALAELETLIGEFEAILASDERSGRSSATS
jgi:DNA gyrase subunit A